MNQLTLIEAVRALLTVATYINEQIDLDEEALYSIASIREGQNIAENLAMEATIVGRPLAEDAARQYVGNVIETAQWWFAYAESHGVGMPPDGDVRDAALTLLVIDNNL